VYVELAAAMELTALLLVTEGIRDERCVVLTVVPAFVLLDCGLFFHGWKPLPTAASASGGGDLLDSLLHWAASIASGVPRRPGWSCNSIKNDGLEPQITPHTFVSSVQQLRATPLFVVQVHKKFRNYGTFNTACKRRRH
jgi:hypothetical protein